MTLDDLTIEQSKELVLMLGASKSEQPSGLNGMIGKKVIMRSYSVGVCFGILVEKDGKEVILENARRRGGDENDYK